MIPETTAKPANVVITQTGPEKDSIGSQGAYIFHEWGRLVGAEAILHRHGFGVRTGIIDAASEDDSMVWLKHNATIDRTLLHKSEGYEIWLTPECLR